LQSPDSLILPPGCTTGHMILPIWWCGMYTWNNFLFNANSLNIYLFSKKKIRKLKIGRFSDFKFLNFLIFLNNYLPKNNWWIKYNNFFVWNMSNFNLRLIWNQILSNL
jgi:hypothetical protein